MQDADEKNDVRTFRFRHIGMKHARAYGHSRHQIYKSFVHMHKVNYNLTKHEIKHLYVITAFSMPD